MPFNEKIFFVKLQKLKNLLDSVPSIVGQEAENFFKDRFHEQGWRDGQLDKWPRKKVDNGYPILRSKNPRGLVDTIVWEVLSDHQVKITAGNPRKPYARIHNEGGVIIVPITPRMKAFFWAMAYKARRAEKEKWKAMALSKKNTFAIPIPKRQYMGKSQDLETNIIRTITNALNRIIHD
jgi:phage gpG-like protein